MGLFEKDKLIGVGIGAGAALALPFVRPVIVAVARPLVKFSIKQGIVAYERARELAARMAEALEDVLVEVRVEAGDALTGRGRVSAGAARAAPQEPIARPARTMSDPSRETR